mmetsp:Transcript_42626/g.84740  ORF Transcript_42626/g.84740 Transcript_42626/m.84740 type:complete len:209 (+) Transcript_42626:148-774(+)
MGPPKHPGSPWPRSSGSSRPACALGPAASPPTAPNSRAPTRRCGEVPPRHEEDTGTVGFAGLCEQMTARRFEVTRSRALSLSLVPFDSSWVIACTAMSTAAPTISRRASTSASACCLTSMTCAISGAYERSTSSKLWTTAPATVTFACKMSTNSPDKCAPSVWRLGMPSPALYGYLAAICFIAAVACSLMKLTGSSTSKLARFADTSA